MAGPTEYVVEVGYDDQADLWFYEVDALNIVGTGCLSKADAERYAQESIAFTLEEDGHLRPHDPLDGS